MRYTRSMSSRIVARAVVLFAVCCFGAFAFGASTSVVISQVYGGGGNVGATFKNDFIELHNKGNVAVSLSGWTVQYADANSNNWQITFLGSVLQPGQYYLIHQAGGASGA